MMKSKYYDAVETKYNILKDKINIILIGTPNHGNLGDHAIAYATLNILKEVFLNANIVEMSMQDFAFDIDALFHLLGRDDIIILQGGGNCGNYYMDDEMIRRYVALRFKKNKIILFPQSVYYSEDEVGEKQRDISSRIYGSNKNLYLMARDAESEYQFKRYFQNIVYKLPDVVLALPQMDLKNEKKGALLCLRNDEEGILEDAQQAELENILREKYSSVKRIDTVVDYAEEDFCRDEELKGILSEIGSAQLVVTDRLHGMIFSIVTGTECIVFPTFNTKVVSAFEEVKDISNVTLAKTMAEFRNALKSRGKKQVQYNNVHIKDNYKQVLNEITGKDVVYPDVHMDSEENEIFEVSGYWSAQHYETEYWRRTIKKEYEKLEISNRERISEVSTYKEWVSGLEIQLEQAKTDCQKVQTERDKETDNYKKWIANLETQLKQTKADFQNTLSEKEKETADYKAWVANLEAQLEQAKADFQNTLSEKEKETADYKAWVLNLENQIKDFKTQYQDALENIAEKDKEILTYRDTVACLQRNIEQLTEDIANTKEELLERERQWNIQQRELFKCIKTERGKNKQP